MADSSPYTKPHVTFPELNSPIRPKPINQGKSYSHFLFKSLFFALFIIVIPLFPSQAPDFINQTIFSKFWELLHLLFIGIAVAYGLFSRRNVEPDLEVEAHSKVDSTPYYVSKMFPVSPIFGDGCEIPCGSYEKRMMHCSNQYVEGDPGVVCSNGSPVMDAHSQSQLPISEDNLGDSVKFDGTNVVQTWNSDYYPSEPVVIVAQPYNTVGECGEEVDYKPLGLPVRSLRSIARDFDSPNYNNESDSSSGSRASYKSSVKSGDRNFVDLGLSNQEQKFNDVAGSTSPISWRSRSRRLKREEKSSDVTSPSYFRPLSADDTQFESLSSRSLQSTTSLSSHTSLYSSLDSNSSDNLNFQEEEMGEKKTFYVSSPENMNSQEEDLGREKASYQFSPRYGRMATKEKYAEVSRPSHFRPMSVDEIQFEPLGSQSLQSTGSFFFQTSLSSSLELVSSETMYLQKEKLGEKKSSHGLSSISSPSPPASRNGEASLQVYHSRGYSVGSLLQDDMKRNLKDDLRDLNGIRGKDPSGNKESGLQSLQPDTEKPAGLTKAPSKGKSVSTRRASGLNSEKMKAGEKCSKQTDEKIEKMDDNVEVLLMRNGESDHLLKGISMQDLDTSSPDLEATFSNYYKRGKEEPSKNVSKEDSDIGLDNIKVSSDEDEVSEYVNDSGFDSEVDKKASEFIAKFKAQIRLQKMASIDRPRGQRTIGNHIR